uniref:Uncharacterized protein n=1 Tax=Candidozyma auris TaxID=498019 RepID=A0A0L0P8Z1_CANAR
MLAAIAWLIATLELWLSKISQVFLLSLEQKQLDFANARLGFG